jgi:UDP-N-acetyl-D-glucosamine dehydrogenase
MPRHVVRRITDLVNDAGVALPDARVLVVGVAYKPNVTDTRESPAYDVIQLLEKRGVDVEYHDPHVPVFETDDYKYKSVPLTGKECDVYDCAVVLTDHSALNVVNIVEAASIVFDTRNAVAGENVWSL